MRKRDKLKNIEQANMVLEQSYLKSKGLLKEDATLRFQRGKQLLALALERIKNDIGEKRFKEAIKNSDIQKRIRTLLQDFTLGKKASDPERYLEDADYTEDDIYNILMKYVPSAWYEVPFDYDETSDIFGQL